MKAYTVHQLAEMAGVSVRTLHHYDQIGLLKPSSRTEKGYRQYAQADLLRLQQILFYRELDFPLREIQRALDEPGFDPVKALRTHRRELERRAGRLERLLNTIDKTILKLTEETMTLTDDELYAGFTKEERETYPREAEERYGEEQVRQSVERARKMTKAQWEMQKKEGEEVPRLLAARMDKDPGDPEVQALIARHCATIEVFYEVTAEIYRGLGQMYVDDPRFRANYDKFKPGLADFMKLAMEYYAEHTLAKK